MKCPRCIDGNMIDQAPSDPPRWVRCQICDVCEYKIVHPLGYAEKIDVNISFTEAD